MQPRLTYRGIGWRHLSEITEVIAATVGLAKRGHGARPIRRSRRIGANSVMTMTDRCHVAIVPGEDFS